MSQFNLFALPQGRTGASMRLNIKVSIGATEQIGARRRESINIVGGAGFCRPHF
jgi:hypothetical protein